MKLAVLFLVGMTFGASAANRLDYRGTWYANPEAKQSGKPSIIYIGLMDATVNNVDCETDLDSEELTIKCGE